MASDSTDDNDAYLQHANLLPVDLSAIQWEIQQNMIDFQALFASLYTSPRNPISNNSLFEPNSFGLTTDAQWHNNKGKP